MRIFNMSEQKTIERKARSKTWKDREKHYAKHRECILQIIKKATQEGLPPLDYSEIAYLYRERYHYIPSIERRLRELVEKKELKKNKGPVPTFELGEEKR
jgi:hypothetical protein